MGIPAPPGVAALGIPPPGDHADIVVEGVLGGVGPGLPFPFRGSFNVNIWGTVSTTLTTTAGSLNFAVASGTGLGVGAAIKSSQVPSGATIGTFASPNGTLALPSIQLIGQIDKSSLLIMGLLRTDGLANAVISSPNIPAGAQVVAIVREAQALPGFPVVPGVVQINMLPNASNLQEPITFDLGPAAITVTGDDPDATFTSPAALFVGTVQLEKSYDGGASWLICGVGGGGQQAIYTAGTAVGFVVSEPEMDVLYRVNCPAYTSGTINYRMSQSAYGASCWGIPPG